MSEERYWDMDRALPSIDAVEERGLDSAIEAIELAAGFL